MKILLTILTFNIIIGSAQAQTPALHKDTLLQHLEKTIASVQNNVFDYQGEKLRDGVFKTYFFSFYGQKNGTFYSGDNDTRIEIGFDNDAIRTFMNDNLKVAVEEYARNHGFKTSVKKVNLKTIRKKYTTLQVIDPDKNFPVVDVNIFENSRSITFYSGLLDPNIARYYGVVTCLTYQSSNAANSDYSGVEYIYVYAKGNPNMSGSQIIQYAQANTPQQISRRSWQWLGKVNSQQLEKQKKLQRTYGKVVFEQSVTIN